jgi:hypothetical protein
MTARTTHHPVPRKMYFLSVYLKRLKGECREVTSTELLQVKISLLGSVNYFIHERFRDNEGHK